MSCVRFYFEPYSRIRRRASPRSPRRLKFRRARTLWSREPSLCRQISARRRASGTNRCSVKQLYPKSERAALERKLRRYLGEENPPSLNEIASRLGFKGSGSIRERFPKICRAITSKRKQWRSRKRERIRLVIEAARHEVPPPTLKQIGRRLGYTCEVVISAMFPKLCDSYKEWRSTRLEEQRRNLRRAIREWVASETAPTVNSLCRRFGISPTYFQLNVPEDNKELVQRSAECARAARADRARILREDVLRIVAELRRTGIYPSLPRVRAELPSGSTRCSPVIRAAIDEALCPFDVMLRRRNELGRFV